MSHSNQFQIKWIKKKKTKKNKTLHLPTKWKKHALKREREPHWVLTWFWRAAWYIENFFRSRNLLWPLRDDKGQQWAMIVNFQIEKVETNVVETFSEMEPVPVFPEFQFFFFLSCPDIPELLN